MERPPTLILSPVAPDVTNRKEFDQEWQFSEDMCYAQSGLSKVFDADSRCGEWRLAVNTEHYAFQGMRHEPVRLGKLVFRGALNGTLTLALET